MLSKVRKMETKLEYIGDKEYIKGFSNEWYLVDMPHNLNGDMVFVLDKHIDTGWGDDRLCFTGMYSLMVLKEELERDFRIIE